MRPERLSKLPLNTVTPNFVAIFVFLGTASSFIERISFSEIKEKREAILFLIGCSEVNSTWIMLITSGLKPISVRQKHYSLVWYMLIVIIFVSHANMYTSIVLLSPIKRPCPHPTLPTKLSKANVEKGGGIL